LTSNIRSQIRCTISNSAKLQHTQNDALGGNTSLLTSSHSPVNQKPFDQKPFDISALQQSRNLSAPSSSSTQTTQADLFSDIHKVLATGLDDQHTDGGSHTDRNLSDISQYYFDGKGKAIRPRLSLTVADAVNHTLFSDADRKMADGKMSQLFHNQRQIAIISEMFHTASLYHDDVIDKSEARRAKESVNLIWGQKRSVVSGDYVVAIANKLLGMTRDPEANVVMAQILFDLVVGEFQQMAKAKDDRRDRFQTYIDKTYNKTASLMANASKAVAVLALNTTREGHTKAMTDVPEQAFSYGRNVGIAFQLIDDWLDFSSSAELLGKPAAADMKLGLATAPVLFAADAHPEELEPMIKRRFSHEGDVEKAFEIVINSQGLEKTKTLAYEYCKAATDNIQPWSDSPAKSELKQLIDVVVERMT